MAACDLGVLACVCERGERGDAKEGHARGWVVGCVSVSSTLVARTRATHSVRRSARAGLGARGSGALTAELCLHRFDSPILQLLEGELRLGGDLSDAREEPPEQGAVSGVNTVKVRVLRG